MMVIRHWLVSLLVVLSLVTVGCSTEQASTQTPSNSATTATPTQASTPASPKPAPRLEGKATVVLTVKGEPITIEVDGTNAPVTAGNFVDLVQRGVYDGLVFHRVVRDPEPFVVQGGDPQSKDPNFPPNLLGTGGFVDPTTGAPRYVPLEIKAEGAEAPIYSQTLPKTGAKPVLRHRRGAVAMARSSMPDSASSQFYIALAELGFLDGDYAVFGYVTQGMEVVDKIQGGDRIESAKVTQGAGNLKAGS